MLTEALATPDSEPSTALTVVTAAPLAGAAAHRQYDFVAVSAAERLKQWLGGLGHNTQRAYQKDLVILAVYMGETNPGTALDRLCQMPRARALTYMEEWRNTMLAAGLSSSTINRRLAAANSALREIGKADIGPGRLDMKGVTPELRKDVRGPKISKVARAVEALEASATPRDLRNALIVRLAAQRGLRRSEIAGLTLDDVNLDAAELRIQRKGQREKTTVQLAAPTVAALRRWLAVRPYHAAPTCQTLLVTMSNVSTGLPLTDGSLFDIIRSVGCSVGDANWRPHGLRHTAITFALSATGNIEAARELAGHKSVATTQRYLDDRREVESLAVGKLGEAF